MKPEGTNDTYQGLLGLDGLSKKNKYINWVACLVIATCVAFYYYSSAAQTIVQFKLMTFFHWIAIISPTCIAVSWLRLTGIKWKHALLLFILVPLIIFMLRFSFGILILLFFRFD